MAKRRPRDPSKPHPLWNAVIGRRAWKLKNPKPRGKADVSKRDRAKDMRSLKREYGLTRRDMGAIGAGHMDPPWEAGS